MNRYITNWAYASSLGGPWPKGEIVELDPEIAELINRDSPGVLSPEGPKQEDRIAEGRHDRQLKQAPSKRKG